MNNLNSVLIEGTLEDEPDTTQGPERMAVTSFSVLSLRTTKNRDDKPIKRSISVPCTALGRVAEVCAEYLHKGRGVRIVGRLDQETYFDDNGAERERMFIVAEHVEFKPQLKKE